MFTAIGNHSKNTFSRFLVFLAFALLPGCNFTITECLSTDCGSSSAPSDQPGRFSYYALTQFQSQDSLCILSNDGCTTDIQQNLAAQLSAKGWSLNNGFSVFQQNFKPTVDPTEQQFIGETANLVWMSTHGSVPPAVPNTILCLWACDSVNMGGDIAVSPRDIPSAWQGPNWLVFDACDVVQPGVAWEHTFGGSLHGILGWNTEVHSLGDFEQSVFTKLVGGYDEALNAWESATSTSSNPMAMSALIPTTNVSDSIEAAGGPHFGLNGQINLEYFAFPQSSSTQVSTAAVAHLGSVPSSGYSLIPEQMSEAAWYSQYGGGNVPSVVTHPSANENIYRNQGVFVDHFLASGGLLVATEATQTAQGFSVDEAYQYASTWMENNGGLPADAALSYAGPETISPTSIAATTDRPFPNVRQYMFIWRHANSGLLGGDKIVVTVDDAGKFTTTVKTVTILDPHCRCFRQETIAQTGPPWIPEYHMHTYVRMWRSLGAAIPLSGVAKVTAASYAYCGTDMDASTSAAQPCAIVAGPTGNVYKDITSGAIISSSESI